MFGLNDNKPADNSTAPANLPADLPVNPFDATPPAPFADPPGSTPPAPSPSFSMDQPAPLAAPVSSSPPAPVDAPAPAPAPTPAPEITTHKPAADNSDDLLNLKGQVLNSLQPLVSHLDQSPEEKFKTTMMLIQATDNPSLVKEAYDTANQIKDEKTRAQALLDVVNEINYFTQHDKPAEPKA